MSSMMPPPLTPDKCALGSRCSEKPKEDVGGLLCGRCMNLSEVRLLELAKLADEEIGGGVTTHVILPMMTIRETESLESYKKENLAFCACKDYKYRSEDWRKGFDPKDHRPCGPVAHRGQLCTRCYAAAKAQNLKWVKEFAADRTRGYPCVFGDDEIHPYAQRLWQEGPEILGVPFVTWSPELSCERADKKFGLCPSCYDRIHDKNGFKAGFDDKGVLLAKYHPGGSAAKEP